MAAQPPEAVLPIHGRWRRRRRRIGPPHSWGGGGEAAGGALDFRRFGEEAGPARSGRGRGGARRLRADRPAARDAHDCGFELSRDADLELNSCCLGPRRRYRLCAGRLDAGWRDWAGDGLAAPRRKGWRGLAVRLQLRFEPGGVEVVGAREGGGGSGRRWAGRGLGRAPVADVRSNARDAVIGDRSFGSNPAVVAPLVAAAVQGMHEGGVGATLKHFPGLGGAPGDPHIAIPTDPESEARWESVQMPAFQAGIAAGANAVMTTAVYVPGLGGGNTPAMFSAPVVSRLRTQLNFGGVIMSDSVSMGGIEARWSLPEAAVMALAAGNDLVLLGNGDTSYEADALAAVRAAVLSGRLDRTRLHESARRVNALRDRWGRRFTSCRAPLAA